MKEHIRLLEDRVKELVSQNFKLVQRLTLAEENNVHAEIKQQNLEQYIAREELDMPIQVQTAVCNTKIQNNRMLPPASAKAAVQVSKLHAPS